ncbi:MULTISPECIES: condensin complex protein MksE [unclassified Ferrimonas]|uniref:condensin complex protein MksE n=1 Tax=unclassified Ferrimonas TaxID=2620587 RepID=UPI0025747D4E|nr:hypothetical protein [Ferrimonas sp. YFM]BDY05758.1 hypothetical protein F0521_27990 [Ferrimonas sp. YFM]
MIFKQTVEKLLAGAVICQTAYPDEFEYLQAPANAERVHEFLSQLDRSLTHFETAAAFYCSYDKVDDSNRKGITQLFSSMRSYFRPMVEWLDMLLRATGNDAPLHAKDSLKFTSLLEAFEHDQTLAEQLRRLTTMPPFKTNRVEIRDQLGTVLSKLEEMGYLVRHAPGSNTWYATARFDLIYLLIEFLNDSEKLELPEVQEQDPQEELLL